MSAPGGTCISCGKPLEWTVWLDEMWVRCPQCLDLFGTDIAGVSYREGREAVMPDGRPCRSMELIVQDASIHAVCKGG